MSAFRRASAERINVFPVADEFWFKAYLEDELFAELSRYYKEYDYRFEVPADRFEYVRSLLEENGYAPTVVENLEPFAVVKRKYTDHPTVLFRGSVFQEDLGRFNCFVMKDQDARERAIDAGATPIEETDLELD